MKMAELLMERNDGYERGQAKKSHEHQTQSLVPKPAERINRAE